MQRVKPDFLAQHETSHSPTFGGATMASIAVMFGGGRKAPAMVRKDQLAALIAQLREHGTHRDRKVLKEMGDVQKFFKTEEGTNGGWKVVGSLQGRVESDQPTRWTQATTGGAWVHAAAGWWNSEEEARAALDEATKIAFADELAENEEKRIRSVKNCAIRDVFSARLSALSARNQTTHTFGYGISVWENGFSTGGAILPYTEENVAKSEATVTAHELRLAEQAKFEAAAPALVAELIRLGYESTRIDYFGINIIENGKYKTFPKTLEGIETARAFINAETDRRTKFVMASAVNMAGLFGGAAVVSDKKHR